MTVSGYASLDYAVAVSAPPAPDATVLVEQRLSAPWPAFGGCGPRVAMGLVEHQIESRLVSWLGDDAGGQHFATHLAKAGVDTEHVTVSVAARTAASWLCYAPDGSATCIYDPGSSTVEPTHLPAAVDGPLVVTVGPARVTDRLLDIARGPVLWSMKADADAFPPSLVRRLVERADVVVCSGAEVAFVDAVDTDWRARTTAVVTHGPGAIEVWQHGETQRIAVEAITVSDSTGAGDAFVAGMVARLSRSDAPIETAIRAGAEHATALLRRRERANA